MAVQVLFYRPKGILGWLIGKYTRYHLTHAVIRLNESIYDISLTMGGRWYNRNSWDRKYGYPDMTVNLPRGFDVEGMNKVVGRPECNSIVWGQTCCTCIQNIIRSCCCFNEHDKRKVTRPKDLIEWLDKNNLNTLTVYSTQQKS